MVNQLEDVTEKEWQQQVKDMAALMGFKRAYHTFDSRRSSSGFPDLVLVRDRIVYVELKRELTGKRSIDRDRELKPAQREWLAALVKAKGEVYVARPSDFDALAEVLRWRPPRTITSADTELGIRTLAELDTAPPP